MLINNYLYLKEQKLNYLQKIIIKSFYLLLFFQLGVSFASEAKAVATFHSMSLYWTPESGAFDRDVLIKYKKTSESIWKEGLPMRYNPILGTDKAAYRGSVVNLTPGTSYDFKLELEGTSESTSLTSTTWNEQFPIGSTINLIDSNTKLRITKGGTSDAYKVYDGKGSTIDVKHKYNACIEIDASYVIVRRFILKGAGVGEGSWPPIGAVTIANGVHDVVIEECDISDFGRKNPSPTFETHGYNMDSGITFYPSSSANIKRIIIQRNKIHHPTYDCSNWYEPEWPTHSDGPQGISMWNTQGNIVIRYNELYSDKEHMFNDIIGGGDNSSYLGSPGPDSDIYCNYISHTWDDAIEMEGGGQNVRCWNNYITQAMITIANAAVTIGPLYIWRNVTNKSEWWENGDRGSFIKMGHAGDGSVMNGYTYIFNNTILQENNNGCATGIGGSPEPGELFGPGRIVKHCISRNNILEVGRSNVVSISTNSQNIDNSYDYDLYDGIVPTNSEVNGINGTPTYVSDAGYNATTKTGNFQLAVESAGYDEGVIINNFVVSFEGNAPDIGADENGTPDFQYGVIALFIPQNATTIKSKRAVNNMGKDFLLLGNYPNPFNPSTTIEYLLKNKAGVKIVVYNSLGKRIKILENNIKTAGNHFCKWNGYDTKGNQVAAGIYVYRIEVFFPNNKLFTESRKMILVK